MRFFSSSTQFPLPPLFASHRLTLSYVFASSVQLQKHKKKSAIQFASTPLRFKSYKGAEKVIASQTVGNSYRSDLVAAAMKKWCKLHSYRRVKEGIAKPLQQKKGRK